MSASPVCTVPSSPGAGMMMNTLRAVGAASRPVLVIHSCSLSGSTARNWPVARFLSMTESPNCSGSSAPRKVCGTACVARCWTRATWVVTREPWSLLRM